MEVILQLGGRDDESMSIQQDATVRDLLEAVALLFDLTEGVFRLATADGDLALDNGDASCGDLGLSDGDVVTVYMDAREQARHLLRARNIDGRRESNDALREMCVSCRARDCTTDDAETLSLLIQSEDVTFPLHVAVGEGPTWIVEDILNAGWDVNSKVGFGDTPLMFAVKRKHLRIMELLLARGADVCVKNIRGENALWYAAASDELHVHTALLLRHYPAAPLGCKTDLHPVNERNQNGVNALIRAAASGSRRTLLVLVGYYLRCNVSLDVVDNEGWSVLAHTIRAGLKMDATAAVRLLVEGGKLDVDVDAPDGKPLLLLATTHCSAEVVEMLLNAGADANRPSKLLGLTALMNSVMSRDCKIAEILLQHGADVDQANHYNTTPLMTAAMNGDEKMVALLLRYAANVHRTDSTEPPQTALSLCRSGAVASLLRTHGAGALPFPSVATPG
eukprot:Rhum_TRINITY_DN23524_c0_g1::Rhum_TRINITY_DN23524_c0_g1_i1::g.178242::m.178242